jgi:uncharacterized membrane protein YfcA
MILTDVLLVFAGFLAGVAGGVLGVGGGIVFVPALTVGLGVPQAVAQGTSLAAIVPTSLVGAVTADREGNVVRSRLFVMCALGAVGGGAGALLALALPPGVLTRVFGVFLLASAWRLWRTAGGAQPSGDDAPGGSRS